MIADHRSAAAELALFDALLQQDLATAIAVLDARGVALRWNMAALARWGPSTEAVGLAALAGPAVASAIAQVGAAAAGAITVDLGAPGAARLSRAGDGFLLTAPSPGVGAALHDPIWSALHDSQAAGEARLEWEPESGTTRYAGQWEAMIGHGLDEFAADLESWRCRLHPGDREAALRWLDGHARERAAVSVHEFRMRHKHGGWRRLRARATTAVSSDPERPLRVIVAHEDAGGCSPGVDGISLASPSSNPLFDALQAATCVVDVDGSITDVNQAWNEFRRRNGGDPGRSDIGANYLALCDAVEGDDGSDAHSAAAGIRAVIAGERDRFQLLYPCHSDGEQRWYELRVAPLQRTPPRAVVAGHVDVTRIRQIEARARLLEHAVASANDGILIADACDADQPIVFVNEAFERITGYDRAHAIGRNCRFLQRDDTEQPGLQELRQALAADRPVRVLLRNYRKSGEMFWNSLSVAPVFGPDGARTHHIGIITDVTERMRTTERFERIAEHVPGMIYQFRMRPDGSSTFPYASEGIRRLFGVGPEEAGRDGALVLAAIHPDDVARVRRSVLTSAGAMAPWRSEYRVCTPDGRTIWVEGNSTPVVEFDGSVSWYGFVADTTERKQTEQSLVRALESLEHRNRDLQDFAAIASHDLQEPLRKIRMFGARLSESLVHIDADQRDQLQRITGAAERMSKLIDDLLDYSRAGVARHDSTRVDLGEMVRDVLVDLESRIADGDAVLQIDPLPVVSGDPVQLRQVVQNLLANALKFRKPGRRPLIRISSESIPAPASDPGGGPWARIRIRDNGIGFPPERSEFLFAPFRRLHSRAEYEGTGIGLAIVRRIIERHGGRIAALGQPGEGAEFVVDLPLGG